MAQLRVSVDLENSDPSLLRIERHSFVNLINVVHAELQLIERMAEAPGSLRSAIHLAEAASRAFKEARVARRHLVELSDFARLVESDVDEALRLAGDLAEDEGVTEACAILRGVLGDAHLRVQEVVARHAITHPSRTYGAGELISIAEEAGIAFDGDADEYALPIGFERLLTRISPDGKVVITEVRVTGADPVTVDLCGTAGQSDLAPLGANLRAGELQKAGETGGNGLKAVMLLHYLALPRDRVLVEHDDAAFCASAQLAMAEPSD